MKPVVLPAADGSSSEYSLRIKVSSIRCGTKATARILLDNNSSNKVIGFSYGIRHDPSFLAIEDVRLGQDIDLETNGALSCVSLSEDGLTHQVSSCPVIPFGTSMEILTITYQHVGTHGVTDLVFAGDLPGPLVNIEKQSELPPEEFCAGDAAPVPIRIIAEEAGEPVSEAVRTVGHDLKAKCGDIDVDPPAVEFKDVFLEDSQTRRVTITNVGNFLLEVNNIQLVEDDGDGEFSLEPPFLGRITLASKAMIFMEVSYSPADLVADTGALIIETNDPEDPVVTIPLSGSGASQPSPEIEVDPESLDFGETFIGDSRMLSLTITNAGSAPLTVSEIALASGGSETDFSIIECHFLPITLVPKASVPVRIAYRTLDAGPDADAVIITSDDKDEGVVTVPLAGSGVAKPVAEIDVIPLFHSFGSVTILAPDCGEEAAKVTVTITNKGSAGLLLRNISLAEGSSDEFALEPGLGSRLPAVLQPTEIFEFSAAYCPLDEGPDCGAILIESDDADESTVAVSLLGNGVLPPAPKIEVIPHSLLIDFLEVPIGSSSTFPITITNRGAAPLEGGVLAGSENSPDLAVTELEFNLAPGEEISIPVIYTPGEEGSDSGTAVIDSNDADRPELVVSLIGSGAIPVMANAGNDQILPEESAAELDGSGSAGPTGTALIFHWEQIAGPPAVILAGQDSAHLSIQLPALSGGDQDLVFQLSVNDGGAPPEADDDTVTIRVLDADERRAAVALRSAELRDIDGGRRKIAFDGEVSWLTGLEDGRWSGLAFRIEDDGAIEGLAAATLYHDADGDGEVGEGDSALARIDALDPKDSRAVFAFQQVLTEGRPERFLLVVDVKQDEALRKAGMLLAALLVLAGGVGAAGAAGRRRLAPAALCLTFLALLAWAPLACNGSHHHRRPPGLEPTNEAQFILEAQEGTVFLEGATSRINVPASRIAGLPLSGPTVTAP